MNKYDCSKVLDYVHERNRMCRQNKCDESCPFIKMNECHTGDISQKYIDIVQRWSDEHPEMPKLTRWEREFIEGFCIDQGMAIQRDLKDRLYVRQHSPVYVDSIMLNPSIFPFIESGEEWCFDKLLGLEVSDD